MHAQFVKSFAKFEQMVEIEPLPQIAFVGRSNAGKSSLLNMLTNHKGLAVTSQKPGRTRLINFFKVNDIHFVDLPGYGYSVASKSAEHGWGVEITNYLVKSEHLKLVFVLLDIRHAPSALDVGMLHFLQGHGITFKILATKCDKLSRAQQGNAKMKLATTLGLGKDDIILTSATNRQGREIILSILTNLSKSDIIHSGVK